MVKLQTQFKLAVALAILAAALTGCTPKTNVASSTAAAQKSSAPQTLVQKRVVDIQGQITALENDPNIPQNSKNQQIAALQAQATAMSTAGSFQKQ
jgi:hypothetical protein